MVHKLIGEVVDHDGYTCLEVTMGRATAWYPLGGSSGLAEDFREAFGEAQRGDIGKRVYRVGEVIQMENEEQVLARLHPHNPDMNPNWTPLVAWRVYACTGCGTEATLQTNHTGTVPAEPCHGTCKDILNPHTARERVLWHKPMPHRYIKDAEG